MNRQLMGISSATLPTLVLALLLGCSTTPPGGDVTGTPPAEEGIPQPTANAAAEGSAGNPNPGEPAPAAAAEFVPATLRQEELRGIAQAALSHDDMNLAIAACIALWETPEASGLKASAMLLLAELYHEETEPERCLAVLENLVETFPPAAQFEFVYGRILGDLERYPEAEPHLRQAIELDPLFLQSYLALGTLLVATDRPEDAATVYTAYEGALEQLLQMVGSQTIDVPTRLSLLELMSLTEPDERISAGLVSLLDDPELAITATALQVLATAGMPAALPRLQRFAEEATRPELEDLARHTIARIEARSAP